MWLFTKKGFYSAVAHETEPDTIHLRARFRFDLEQLLHGMTHGEIVETPDSDYRFRTDISVDDWKDILVREASDIDYTNFKEAVHEGADGCGGAGESVRDKAYMEVWGALAEAQVAELEKNVVGETAKEV